VFLGWRHAQDHKLTTATFIIELSGRGASRYTKNVEWGTRTRHHQKLVLCAGSATSGSPEQHGAGHCKGGNGGT